MKGIRTYIKTYVKDIAKRNNTIGHIVCKYRLNKNLEVVRGYRREGANIVISLESEVDYVMGIMSIAQEIVNACNEIVYAGYVPYVDLSNMLGNAIYLPSDEFCEGENPWEYFFTQPIVNSTLDEAYSSENLMILRKDYAKLRAISAYKLPYYDHSEVAYWRKVIDAYLHPSINLSNEIENVRKQINFTEKVLGVAIRAGFAAGGLGNIPAYNGHPVVMPPEYYIPKIEKRMTEWGYDKFFLMIDDREYLDVLQSYFGERLLHYDRPLTHYFVNGKPNINETGDGFGKETYVEFKDVLQKNRSIAYLAEIWGLSFCDSIYCTQGTGQAFSKLIRERDFEHFEVEDNGVYNIPVDLNNGRKLHRGIPK